MEWQPIETYDSLKQKPGFAVFFVAELKSERKSGPVGYGALPEIISTDRDCGFRTVTHWMPLPAPPEVKP